MATNCLAAIPVKIPAIRPFMLNIVFLIIVSGERARSLIFMVAVKVLPARDIAVSLILFRVDRAAESRIFTVAVKIRSAILFSLSSTLSIFFEALSSASSLDFDFFLPRLSIFLPVLLILLSALALSASITTFGRFFPRLFTALSALLT